MRSAVPLALLLAVGAAGSGCGLLRPKKSPDQTYGTRIPPETAEDPDVLTILPPDTTRAFFYTQAPVTGVLPRVEATGPQPDSIRVDVLIRGSFPDACYELSSVSQSKVARLIDVTLNARRPQGAFCATVVRPFRFYLELDGPFVPGPYTLTVNGTVVPFEIRP